MITAHDTDDLLHRFDGITRGVSVLAPVTSVLGTRCVLIRCMGGPRPAGTAQSVLQSSLHPPRPAGPGCPVIHRGVDFFPLPPRWSARRGRATLAPPARRSCTSGCRPVRVPASGRPGYRSPTVTPEGRQTWWLTEHMGDDDLVIVCGGRSECRGEDDMVSSARGGLPGNEPNRHCCIKAKAFSPCPQRERTPFKELGEL